MITTGYLKFKALLAVTIMALYLFLGVYSCASHIKAGFAGVKMEKTTSQTLVTPSH